MPKTAMVARTTADPVDCVSHHATAKCTIWLPISENAWPIQMVKKVFFQFEGVTFMVPT